MKPKLRSDTLYVPTREGVYLLNNRGSLTLRGQRLYEWLERLHPFLDGSRTLDQLVAGVTGDRGRMVVDLVTLLAERGFVKDATHDEPHTLTGSEQEAYAQEIAFVDYFCDSAGRRFETFRNAPVLVVGSGLSFVAAQRVMLQLGTRTLHTHDRGEADTDREWRDDVLAAARRRDPEQTVVVETAEPADLARFAAVVHASDRPMLARAQTIDAACAAAGVPCGHLLILGDAAWIGPISATARWGDAWRRLLHNREGDQRVEFRLADRVDAPVTDFLAVPTASVAAGHLCFEVFKRLAGVPDEELATSIRRLDLGTLAVSTHPIQPTIHPGTNGRAGGGEDEAAFRRRYASALERAEVGEADFSTAVRDCVDPESGLLRSVDEDDLVQLPLRVARARLTVSVSDEVRLRCLTTTADDRRTSERGQAMRHDASTVEATGCGLDFGVARRRAARRGCELYAATVVDPARLVDGPPPRVWAVDPASGEICPVPAEDAFPVLRGTVPGAAATPLLASGSTWWGAVTRALLLAWARHAPGAEEAGGVGIDALELTDAARQYAEQLAVARADVTVHDLGAGLGVPTYEFRVDGEVVARVADLTTGPAVQRGLERCLLHCQAHASGQDVATEVADGWVTRTDATGYESHAARLASLLAARGRRLAAVPLDHDPALRRAWPHVVHLVPRP